MKVTIHADLTQAHQKYVHVQYQIKGIEDDHLVLNFPTWSPGSYLIREYQAQVESFVVVDAKKRSLKWSKLNKCQWQVETKGTKEITLHYRVYANELNVRGVYADHRIVFINPTSCFFHLDQKTHLSVNVAFKTLKGWRFFAEGYDRQAKGSFKNFDLFYDAPILAAEKIQTQQFKTKTTRYTLAFWGESQKDLETIAEDTKKIVLREEALFRGNPNKHYLFQILFVPGQFGGLEHSSSSTNIFDGALLKAAKDYQRFLSLLAHEHFHLWNVKRIRPKGLGPFNYLEEAYTKDLWLAEGATSYYDDHFVYRASLYKTQEYLDVVATNITRLESQKGNKVNSVSESSFDAWIRFYRQNENSMNTLVSYYLKGGLLVMILDLMILSKSKGRKSFDDVMRTLWESYQKNSDEGLEREDFFAAFQKTVGWSVEPFFKKYVDGVESIQWKSIFSPFGLELNTNSSKSNYFGVHLSKKKGDVTITHIVEDSPAYQSQLAPGDELIAINGHRITQADQIDRFLTCDKITVLFSRHGLVESEVIPLAKKGPVEFKLKEKSKPTASQKQLLARFLRH